MNTTQKQRRSFGRRINTWLAEPAGEQFVAGKWRFWFVAVAGLASLNAILTALVFENDDKQWNYTGAIMLSVGALLAWIAVGCLHYSDSTDRKLAQGVSALDSITLLFVTAHFCGLLWVYGHLRTLQSAERKYLEAAEKYNVDARQIQADNAKIADSLRQVAQEETKRARIENDSIYQARKAAQAGVKITPRQSRAAATSLSTSPVEMAKPPEAPKNSSADYLTRWDSWIRLANFGELLLATLTLIFIRNRSAKTNTPSVTRREDEVFPDEIDAGVVQDDRTGRRLSQTRKSDRATTVVTLGDSFDRKAARRKLLEHLRVISHYNPGKWFKADLIEGGVHIRLCARVNTIEETIADTRQSDKLLLAVDRPDFRGRLIDELIQNGFPIEKDKMNL